MIFSEKLLTLRKAKGITQEQLAEKLDVSRQSVSKWESGQSVPELEKIAALSAFFDVSTDYLLKSSEIDDLSVKNSNSRCLFANNGSSRLGLVFCTRLLCIWYSLQYALLSMTFVFPWRQMCLENRLYWRNFLSQLLSLSLYGSENLGKDNSIKGKYGGLQFEGHYIYIRCSVISAKDWKN